MFGYHKLLANRGDLSDQLAKGDAAAIDAAGESSRLKPSKQNLRDGALLAALSNSACCSDLERGSLLLRERIRYQWSHDATGVVYSWQMTAAIDASGLPVSCIKASRATVQRRTPTPPDTPGWED